MCTQRQDLKYPYQTIFVLYLKQDFCKMPKLMSSSMRLLLWWCWFQCVLSYKHQIQRTRRNVLSHIISSSALASGGGKFLFQSENANVAIASELPTFLRPYTSLVPMGSPHSMTSSFTVTKTLGLSLNDIKQRLEHDLLYGSQGTNVGYFLSGDISTDLFRDDCVFADPTNQVSSLSQYQNVLRSFLFDPEQSTVELLQPLQVDEVKRTITGRIRSRGMLRLPWHPYITSYESTIVYTVDDSGLIARQDQLWSKSVDVALRETFTPTIQTPPPKSTILSPSNDEPTIITQLFQKVNGRRPGEYSPEERRDISLLLEDVIANCCSSWMESSKDDLTGRWMVTYLQPGPGGTGLDRRIPFPEFGFNDSFQIFTDSTVVNIGQILGSFMDIRVSGTVQPLQTSSATSNVPDRYKATIEGGNLCVSSRTKLWCPLKLPITGEGIFESIYVGKRLRIGRNVNGGGAIVVQVRLDSI
jgi:Uncharacterized conserved protein (DUF2358)